MILIQCHDTPGEQLGILKTSLHSLQNEVRERRRAQSLAEEALADRDLMLRELQHRVKNNIQVVTALVRTSIRSTTSPEARSVLEKTYARLAAATAVQQLLYQENSFRNIDPRQMLENLVSGLASWIGTEHIVHSQADSVPLPNNAALPLGLIINELITNAIKYGRNASGIAEVDISLTCEEGRFCLEVKDKGPGFEWRETAKKASGLGLVRGLVRQLGGSLNIESENGTQTLVEFEAND
jgi:two-component sensor histidine kinase